MSKSGRRALIRRRQAPLKVTSDGTARRLARHPWENCRKGPFVSKVVVMTGLPVQFLLTAILQRDTLVDSVAGSGGVHVSRAFMRHVLEVSLIVIGAAASLASGQSLQERVDQQLRQLERDARLMPNPD